MGRHRLTNLITGGTLVTYITICVNYIFFHRALKQQNYDRDTLPYKGFFQPYSAWIGLIWMVAIELFYGYEVFLKGNWDIGSFFSSYAMALVAVCTFSGWKIFKRTKFVNPAEADLVGARPAIELHEEIAAEADTGSGWAKVREKLKLGKIGSPFKSMS